MAPNLFLGFVVPDFKPNFATFFAPGVCCSAAFVSFFTKEHKVRTEALRSINETLGVTATSAKEDGDLRVTLENIILGSCVILLKRSALIRLFESKYPGRLTDAQEAKPVFQCASYVPILEDSKESDDVNRKRKFH